MLSLCCLPAHRCCHPFHPLCVGTRRVPCTRIIEKAGPPGWWTPSAFEQQRAAKMGVDLLLVPGLTLPWNCTEGSGCMDVTIGLRGDVLLVVPKGWRPSTTASGRRRVIYLHGGGFAWQSPFGSGFPVFAMQLATRMAAPVLLPDYPKTPVGSHREQLRASLQAMRWFAACECLGGRACLGCWWLGAGGKRWCLRIGRWAAQRWVPAVLPGRASHHMPTTGSTA